MIYIMYMEGEKIALKNTSIIHANHHPLLTLPHLIHSAHYCRGMGSPLTRMAPCHAYSLLLK